MKQSSLCSRSFALGIFFFGISQIAIAQSELDLIFSSDLEGDWIAQNCTDPKPRPAAGLAVLASTIKKAKENSLRTLVLGGGGLLGPGSTARFLMSSSDGYKQAAQLIHEAGIQVISPGVLEFSMAHAALLDYFDMLSNMGSKPVLSNIECTDKQPLLCNRTTPSQLITLDGMTIGILSGIPEDALQHTTSSQTTGVKILPLASLVKRAKLLRSQVDVLVIELDSDSKLTLWDAVGLARALEAESVHADVIHVTHLQDEHGAIKELDLDNGTLLIGTPSNGNGVAKVSFETNPIASKTRQRFITSVQFITYTEEQKTETEALQKPLEQIRLQMCQTWSQTVATLPSQGLNRNLLSQVVLDAMRDQAKAEIAIIQSDAISDRGLPLFTASTEALGNALPFKAEVVRYTVSGQSMIDVLKKYASPDPGQSIAMRGLVLKDGNLLVNGRAILPASRYRIVSTDFLASSGNGLLPDKFLLDDRKLIAEDLQSLVLAYLKRRQTPEAITSPLKLEDRPTWTTNFDLGIDLQNVTINNPNGLYDRPQLALDSTLAYKIDGSVRVQMDHPKHLFQFTFRGQYGQSWIYTNTVTTDPSSPKDWVGKDTANVINTLLLYSYRGFSAKNLIVPTPYASLGLESEFRRPDTRDYSHFELSAAVGLRIALPAQISANAGIGLRSELLADSNSAIDLERDLARPRFLVTVGFEMTKRPLIPKLGNALLAEFLVNYNFTDPTLLQTHEFLISGKLYIALKRPLYLTVGTDFYLYRFLENEPGFSWSLTAGLKVLFDVRNQMF